MTRLRLVAATAASVAILVLPAAAPAADPEFRAKADEPEVVAGQTRGLTYRLEMKTGDAPERFRVHAVVPPAFGSDPDGPFGGVLQTARLAEARLDGPGTVRYEQGPLARPLALSLAPPCSRHFRAGHGVRGYGGSLLVELPQHRATSTLVVPTELAADAPWPGREFRFGFGLADTGIPGHPGTLEGPRVVDAPVVPYRGPRGTRITLASVPPTGCNAGNPAVVRGTLDLAGRTEPALPAGQEIVLDVFAPGAEVATQLARVPVASDGTFALRGYRPAADGFHEIRARYESQSPERAGDFSDPINFTARRPALRVAARSSRPSRRGEIGLRVACPAGECAGRLRIERAGVLLGSARYELAAGARRTLRVAPTRAARRLLQRSRPVAARVRIATDGGGERVRRLVLVTGRAG